MGQHLSGIPRRLKVSSASPAGLPGTRLSQESTQRAQEWSSVHIPLYNPKSILPLPQEIVDIIIDLVANDIVTLRACNLTTRQLNLSVSRYFFHSIILLRSGSRTPLFVEAFRHRPQVAHSVRKITVVGDAGMPQPFGLHRSTTPLQIAVNCCSAVTKLALTRCQFPLVHHVVWASILQSFPRLHRLSLMYCIFDTEQDLCDLVLAHPTLRRLELWFVDLNTDPEAGLGNINRLIPQAYSFFKKIKKSVAEASTY